MFDTPDLMPLCIAPFVAILVGIVIFAIGSGISYLVEKDSGQKPVWLKPAIWIVSLTIIPIACVASIFLDIGTNFPSPWLKPQNSNIVGKWELLPETAKFIQDLYGLTAPPSNELQFKQDGSFSLNNVPTFWGLGDETKSKNDKLISGIGTWYLTQIEGTERMEWVIFAQFQEINGSTDNRIMRFYFEGHLPPYTIVTLDGDSAIFRF